MRSQMKRACRGLLLAIAASAAAALPLDAQEVEQFVIGKDAARSAKTRDEISLDTARRVADDCLRQAAERKTGVAVSILDPAGHVVYAVRSDGQTPVAIETALMKAKTALFMRDSTHAWMNRLTSDPAFAVRLIPLGMYWNSGGLPIVVKDVLIGAIGVGGMGPTPDWSDEICAHNALTRVLGPQPPLAPMLPPGPAR